jgi:hypothetical protein
MKETICLNSKVNGKQPSLQDRIYFVGGVAPAITTGFYYSIMEVEYEIQDVSVSERSE